MGDPRKIASRFAPRSFDDGSRAALDVAGQSMESMAIAGREFQIPLGPRPEPIRKEIYLCDQVGLVSENPFVISIDPIVDHPPTVQTRLKGIGTAITPNAQIPFDGECQDDY